MTLLWKKTEGEKKLYDLIVSPSELHEGNVRKILGFSNVKGILVYLERWVTQTEIRLQSHDFNMGITTFWVSFFYNFV